MNLFAISTASIKVVSSFNCTSNTYTERSIRYYQEEVLCLNHVPAEALDPVDQMSLSRLRSLSRKMQLQDHSGKLKIKYWS